MKKASETKFPWDIPKPLAYVLTIVGGLGALAAISAIPGMPKFLHFDDPKSRDSLAPARREAPPSIDYKIPSTASAPQKKAVVPRSGAQKAIVDVDKNRIKTSLSLPTTAPKSQVLPEQKCEVGSVCIGRDNNGSVDIHLDKLVLAKRVISPNSFKKAFDQLSTAPLGLGASIEFLSTSQETKDFSLQLINLFQSRGWVLNQNQSARPTFVTFNGDASDWTWEGKGFICTGYAKDDPYAVAALRAIKATGYPCEEKPSSMVLTGAGTITLLVGTREDRSTY